MVSPVELSKLGVRARFQRLGSLKYILLCGLLFLGFAGVEMLRYKNYDKCVNIETKNITIPAKPCHLKIERRFAKRQFDIG
jgi:hypothetical protein